MKRRSPHPPDTAWSIRFARVQRITAWLEARHERARHRKRQLAFYYARKSGVFSAQETPSGYWFHCLHNWTIGNGCAAGNAFALKALAAWNSQWDGQHEQMQRIYQSAYARYAQSAA